MELKTVRFDQSVNKGIPGSSLKYRKSKGKRKEKGTNRPGVFVMQQAALLSVYCNSVDAYSHRCFSVLPLPFHQVFPLKVAAAVHEALASSDSNGKEELILKECSSEEVVNLFVRRALHP